MLNMKKGLAIVLAAATAFTFAPVSTLGLTGVVEAQAASAISASDVKSVSVDSTVTRTSAATAKLTLTFTSTSAFTDGDAVNVGFNSSDTAVIADVSAADLPLTLSSDKKTGTVTFNLAFLKRGSANLTLTGTSLPAGSYTSAVSNTYDTKAEVTSVSGSINSQPSVQNGTSYDLIGNDVSIKYVGAGSGDITTYQGKQLTWALQAYDQTAAGNAGLGLLGKEVGTKSAPSLSGLATISSDGKLSVTKAADFVEATNADDATNYADYIALVGIATEGGKNVVVYATKFTATEVKGQLTTVSASVSAKPNTDYTSDKISDDFLDGIRFEDATGHYKKAFAGSETIKVAKSGTDKDKFSVTLGSKVDGAIVNPSVGDYPLKGAKLNTATGVTSLPAGVYHFTLTVTYDTDYAEVINVTVTVGAGPKIRVFEGANIYGSTISGDKKAADPTIYLDLQNNKTFDISKNIFSDTANTTYKYKTNTAGVTVDSNGLITAVRAGTATVTVTPTAAGVEGEAVDLAVRVNANGFDSLTVVGKDNDAAKVLSSKEYTNNTETTEKMLAWKQIGYVQIEVTGNETTNITETPKITSANNASLSYSFAYQKDSKATINPSTGEITIPYEDVKPSSKAGLGVYVVKVVSAATSKSAQTTSYYYVVVDYPDLAISGIEDKYTLGVCGDPVDVTNDKSHKVNIGLMGESNGTVTAVDDVDKDRDSFVGAGTYKDDDKTAFTYNKTNGNVFRALTAGKTMHFLVSNTENGVHGNTYKVVTVTSAAANNNYVEKIVNKDTGATIYDHSVDAAETAKKLDITGITNIQVTLHTPVAVSGSATSVAISKVTDDGSVIDQNRYITAVKNTNNIDVVLYPNSEGTEVIFITSAGHNSKTDRTDVHSDGIKLAVQYTGSANVTPAKVSGLKLKNKKGAKVTVTFSKDNTAPTIKYYVQKKVSGKTSGKSIGSNKTTLSVKKGATVKVRVKAYYYDANGVKHVGKYSSWKTLKTDKK